MTGFFHWMSGRNIANACFSAGPVVPGSKSPRGFCLLSRPAGGFTLSTACAIAPMTYSFRANDISLSPNSIRISQDGSVL
jgi:hypothetical protein